MTDKAPAMKNMFTASNWRLPLFLVTVSFATGAAIGGYLGLPLKVDDLSNDVRGLACIIISLQESVDTRNCELLLSRETQTFIGNIRNNRPPYQPTALLRRHINYPWLSKYEEEVGPIR